MSGEITKLDLQKQIEIAVQITHDPSTVTNIITLVGSCGIHILASRHYWGTGGGVVLLVTEDPGKTEQVLEEAGFLYRSDSVLMVSGLNRLGSVAELGERLQAAGIPIIHSYTTSSEAGHTVAVFKTENDEKAMHVLQPNGSAAPAKIKEALDTLFRMNRGTSEKVAHWNGFEKRRDA